MCQDNGHVCAPHPRRPHLNSDLFEDSQALLGGKIGAAGTTRRMAMKTALGVGYAAAALPIASRGGARQFCTGSRRASFSPQKFQMDLLKVYPCFTVIIIPSHGTPQGPAHTRSTCSPMIISLLTSQIRIAGYLACDIARVRAPIQDIHLWKFE